MAINSDFIEGIVIYERKHGESSKILKIFTKELGNISIMAKGSCSPKSSILSLSQVFVEGLYLFRPGRNFYYIKSGRLINSNYELRNNFTNLCYASLILEIVEKSTLQSSSLNNIYRLLSKILRILCSSKDPSAKTMAFILKFMSFMGYRPILSVFENNFFSLESGVVTKNSYTSYSIFKEDIYYLRNLLYTSLDKDFIYDEGRKKYLFFILTKYLKYNLEIGDFNSLKFL